MAAAFKLKSNFKGIAWRSSEFITSVKSMKDSKY